LCCRVLTGLIVGALCSTCACQQSKAPAGHDLQPADARHDQRPDIPRPVTAISFALKRSVTVAQPSSGHLAFPSVTPRSDGLLLLAYRHGAAHVDATGRIDKQIGTADGTSWKPAETLLDTAGVDDRDPSLTTLSSGDLALSYFRYSSVSTASGTLTLHHIIYCRSKDSGATFGACTQVDDGAMSVPQASIDSASGRWVDPQGAPIQVMAVSSPVVQLGQRLILAAYGGPTLNLGALASAARSRIALYESGDSGKSWSARTVNPDQDKQVWQQEPALLSLGAQDWLLQIRTSVQTSPGGAGYLAQARSADGGKTWSAFSNLSFIGHAPELYRLSNGVLLSAYRGIDASYAKASVAFVSSTDAGKSWSAPITVVDCGSAECGYPTLLELPGDQLLLVYYAPGGKAIKAAIYHFNAS
jgi:BNR repeat-like domain